MKISGAKHLANSDEIILFLVPVENTDVEVISRIHLKKSNELYSWIIGCEKLIGMHVVCDVVYAKEGLVIFNGAKLVS